MTFCGIGRSHLPLIRLFQEKGALVSARDKRSLEELGENGKLLESLGVRLVLGEGYLQDLNEDDDLPHAGHAVSSSRAGGRPESGALPSPARWRCFSSCAPARSTL